MTCNTMAQNMPRDGQKLPRIKPKKIKRRKTYNAAGSRESKCQFQGRPHALWPQAWYGTTGTSWGPNGVHLITRKTHVLVRR